MWEYVFRVTFLSACPNLPLTVTISSPDEISRLALVWRSWWNVIFGRLWRFKNFVNHLYGNCVLIGFPSSCRNTYLPFCQAVPNFNLFSFCCFLYSFNKDITVFEAVTVLIPASVLGFPSTSPYPVI